MEFTVFTFLLVFLAGIGFSGLCVIGMLVFILRFCQMPSGGIVNTTPSSSSTDLVTTIPETTVIQNVVDQLVPVMLNSLSRYAPAVLDHMEATMKRRYERQNILPDSVPICHNNVTRRTRSLESSNSENGTGIEQTTGTT